MRMSILIQRQAVKLLDEAVAIEMLYGNRMVNVFWISGKLVRG
jgi:hypothetical protein